METMESILLSIKKMLGITADYTHFDMDIIMHINSVFLILNQIGVGPAEGFSIYDETSTWEEFLEGNMNLELVKSYMFMKVKLLFDPPLASSTNEAMNRLIAESEWRLYLAMDMEE